MSPLQSFYAFQRIDLPPSLTVSICRFCGERLAYSQHPEFLVIVEEHHSCPAMRDALENELHRMTYEAR